MSSDKAMESATIESLKNEAEQLQKKLHEERKKLNDAESKTLICDDCSVLK